jgi:hypothetical protein
VIYATRKRLANESDRPSDKKLTLPEDSTRQKTFFDGSLKGFGLRVSVGGAKSFIVMYGKRRKLKTLGRYPETSLAKARVLARQVLGEVAGLRKVKLSKPLPCPLTMHGIVSSRTANITPSLRH